LVGSRTPVSLPLGSYSQVVVCPSGVVTVLGWLYWS
jgi:hypothetical protein